MGDVERWLLAGDLVGSWEIADRMGWAHPEAVHAARRRDPSFPGPVATLCAAMVWSWIDLERWAQMTGRLPPHDGGTWADDDGMGGRRDVGGAMGPRFDRDCYEGFALAHYGGKDPAHDAAHIRRIFDRLPGLMDGVDGPVRRIASGFWRRFTV